MNHNRIISIILIICLLSTTIISPTSFAASGTTHLIDKGNGIVTMDRSLSNELNGNNVMNPITVGYFSVVTETSGVYAISNQIGSGNGGDTQYMICVKDDDGKIKPLPVATFVSSENGVDPSSATEIQTYNNPNDKTTSVYLQEGKEYYVCLLGFSGYAWEDSSRTDVGSESNSVKFQFDHIDPAGRMIVETNVSSIKYTAPEGTDNKNYGVSPRDEDGNLMVGGGIIPIEKNDIAVNEELSTEGISEETINQLNELVEQQAENVQSGNEDQKASWYESVITWFVVRGVCDSLVACINYIMDSDITIDDLLLNSYPKTKLSFFHSETDRNPLLESSNLVNSYDENGNLVRKGILTQTYDLFQKIAIACYIIALLYMGVNILLSSTGKKKGKYKDVLIGWVKGVIILAFFPYVMKYTIVINNTLVEYIKSLRDEINVEISSPSFSGVSDDLAIESELVDSDDITPNDIMKKTRKDALDTGRLAYAMLYLFLIKQLIGFIYIYFKRLIIVLFLIVIFPLVTITYAFDKIKDGKAQAFSQWFSEYILNVFTQFFHAVIYLIVMSIIFAFSEGTSSMNIILMLIGLDFIAKGDTLLRGMFSKITSGGNTVSKLSETVKTLVSVKMASNVINNVKQIGGRVTNFSQSITNVRNAYQTHEFNKIAAREESRLAAEEAYRNVSWHPENVATSDVSGNIRTVLTGLRSPEEQKEALDRIMTAMQDSRFHANVEAARNSGEFTEDELKKIDELIKVNHSMNELIGNKEMLTNLEINAHLSVIVDAINKAESGDTTFKGIHKFMKEKHLLNPDGSVSTVTVKDALLNMAEDRILDTDGQRKATKVQRFIGNRDGIDMTQNGTARVQKPTGPRMSKFRDRLTPAEQVAEATMKQDLVNTYGDATATADVQREQELAAAFVTRMKRYQDEIASGRSSAMTPEQAMKASREWNHYKNSANAGTQAIIAQLGSRIVTADVGFEAEEFTAAASLAYLNDIQNVEGTDEEIKQNAIQAFKNIREISRDSTTTETAKALVNASEWDHVLKMSDNEFREFCRQSGTMMAMRTTETQEDRRDKRVYEEREREITRAYDNKRESVGQTRAKLIREAANLVGATTSVATTPLNVASGVFGGALHSGMAGEARPENVMASVDVGMKAENKVEGVIMGTPEARRSSSSIGGTINRVSGEIIDSRMGISDEQHLSEIQRRQREAARARNSINTFRNRIG